MSVKHWQPFSLCRYILASFYTKYDPTHFLVNTCSLLSVLLPKLPQFHGVRIFGINKYWRNWANAGSFPLSLTCWLYRVFRGWQEQIVHFWLYSWPNLCSFKRKVRCCCCLVERCFVFINNVPETLFKARKNEGQIWLNWSRRPKLSLFYACCTSV